MIKTAVVILNWNGKEYLKKFLADTIKKSHDKNCKVFIADNGSTDDSCDYIRKQHPLAEVIELGVNHGFAGGYNKALEKIDAEYFILLNSDVQVSDNWIKPVIDYMDNNKNTVACQPKILSYNEKSKFEHAGASGGYIDRYGYPFCRGRVMNIIEEDKGQYDDIQRIFWASGACLFIRSDIWRENSGFDPDFFTHMEEIDLCWRINSAGWEIKVIPESAVYHVGGGTLSYDSPKKLYYNFRNSLYLLYKNLPDKQFRSLLFRRKILDGIAAIRFLLILRFNLFSVVYKSHLDFYKNLKTLKEKRKNNILRNNIISHDLILNKNLVFSFYLKGKKSFKDLVKSSNLK